MPVEPRIKATGFQTTRHGTNLDTVGLVDGEPLAVGLGGLHVFGEGFCRCRNLGLDWTRLGQVTAAVPAELEDAEARELQVGGLLPSRGRTRAWRGRERRRRGGTSGRSHVDRMGSGVDGGRRQEDGELATLESTLTPLVGRR